MPKMFIRPTAPWMAGLAAFLLANGALAQVESDSIESLQMAREAIQYGEYLVASQNFLRAAEQSSKPEIAQQATRVAVGFGFDAEALLAAQRWLELEPDSEQALVYVARYQFRSGAMREARRNFKRLLKKEGADADERLLSLVQVLADEDPQASYELVSYLAKPYRKSALAQYGVAVMAMAASELDVANERAALALELDPDWLKAKLLYARTLLLDGRQEEAVDYTARIIGDDPDPDPDARMELALMYVTMDRNDDALSQVSQILLEQPGRADALRLMGIVNFREQNLDAATQDFEDLLSTRRYTSDALYYLGRIADFRGETEKAIRFYASVQDGEQAVFAQRRASGLLAFQLEQPDNAILLLDQFATKNAAYAVDIVLAKAQLLAGLERFDDALVNYDRYADFRPDSEDGMLGRAQLLLQMERLDAALEQYRAAVAAFPESATSLNALGYTLADRTEEYAEAERLIRKALRIEPQNPAIIDSLGWVLFRLGDNEQALSELQRAYAAFDDPEVAAHIVEVLHALERHDEALAMLASAEEKDPEDALLENVRSRLYPDAND